MKRTVLRNNQFLVASPWLTVGLLAALSIALPNRSGFNPDAEQRKAVVGAAMKAAPFFIGRWVGEDSTHLVPREAQTLLHPNALMSRSYRTPAGPTVHVLVVHCGDARDMIGHYPPICYPSAGWQPAAPPEPQDIVLAIGPRRLPVRQYVFQCVNAAGRVDSIRIFNAFVLPDGRAALDIDDINRQSERLALAVQGVAQLQLITSGTAPLPEAVQAANEILGGMSELFDALQLGSTPAASASASPLDTPRQGAST